MSAGRGPINRSEQAVPVGAPRLWRHVAPTERRESRRVVLGPPRAQMLPEAGETDLLVKYLAGGGRLLLLLDPVFPVGADLQKHLLGAVGLSAEPAIVIDPLNHFRTDLDKVACPTIRRIQSPSGLRSRYFPKRVRFGLRRPRKACAPCFSPRAAKTAIGGRRPPAARRWRAPNSYLRMLFMQALDNGRCYDQRGNCVAV